MVVRMEITIDADGVKTVKELTEQVIGILEEGLYSASVEINDIEVI